MPGFGRLHAPDSRDHQYPMRMLLRPTKLPSRRYYNIGKLLPLDQGDTGTCVAHAWTGFLDAAPLMCKNAPSPFDTYRGIVLMDEFNENDVEATLPNDQLQMGTSVRGGAKYLQGKGFLKSYVWAQNADEAAQWLLTGKGCLVAGTDWYYGMSELDSNGYAIPEGAVLGGHSYLIIGYNRVTKSFRMLNSWGAGWGTGGRAWIHHMDMDKLIKADGEMCAAVEQLVKPV